MAVVLDASALLAYLREDPGAEMVQTSLSADVHVDGMQEELQALGMRVEPFLPVDGERATRQQG
jgi:ribonuclease VapC